MQSNRKNQGGFVAYLMIIVVLMAAAVTSVASFSSQPTAKAVSDTVANWLSVESF